MNQRSVPTQGCLGAIFGQSRGCLWALIIIPVLIVGVWLLTQGVDSFAAPWAHTTFGGPTLTGHWLSTFTMPSGLKFAVYMEIERPSGIDSETSDEYAGELITGRAAWCDNHGRHVDNGVLTGSVPSFTCFNGSADKVAIQIDAGNPTIQGLLPTFFNGQWHGDTLTLGTNFPIWNGTGLVSSTDNPDQNASTIVTFKHGEMETYRAACARSG